MIKYRVKYKTIYRSNTIVCNDGSVTDKIYECRRPCIQMKVLGLFWITIAKFYNTSLVEANKRANNCYNYLNNYTDE